MCMSHMEKPYELREAGSGFWMPAGDNDWIQWAVGRHRWVKGMVRKVGIARGREATREACAGPEPGEGWVEWRKVVRPGASQWRSQQEGTGCKILEVFINR